MIGKEQDSEPETKAIESIILSKQGQWDSYVSLHSYGQFFFTPWGFTTILPSDFEDLVQKAKIATNAIKSVNGSEYQIGPSSSLLYMSSGGSEDWVKAKAGVKYSYSIELGPKDADFLNGFIVPESDIPIAGEEMYRGLIALYIELMKEKPKFL
ncbi:unnamed protein product [Brachionus calyciflorus]|uniref:Peptidase M14 domain-containing protein n=1 Tax=Brachionus calyciflorus TaxID=104777 RepID=A0A813P289_9BILA|nr:unnamed protein product [Brachionus calyciflorus]